METEDYQGARAVGHCSGRRGDGPRTLLALVLAVSPWMGACSSASDERKAASLDPTTAGRPHYGGEQTSTDGGLEKTYLIDCATPHGALRYDDDPACFAPTTKYCPGGFHFVAFHPNPPGRTVAVIACGSELMGWSRNR